MPSELLDDLRRAAGADQAPPDAVRRRGLAALQREIDRGSQRRWRPAIATAGLAVLGLAAVALAPGGGPGTTEVLQRAAAAAAPDTGTILFAETRAQARAADGTVTSYGTRRVWVRPLRGERATVRWLAVTGGSGVPAGAEEVSGPDGVERYDPVARRVTFDAGAWMPPGEVFRASALVRQARAHAGGVELTSSDAAYKLEWDESPGVHMTLWIDRETYAPLRFSDRSEGRTFTETVVRFERLPDTPANRGLLELSADGRRR